MDPEGYLPIALIASFPRIKALSSDISMVLSAVQESEQLEMFKNFKVRTKNEPTKWPIKIVPGEENQSHSQNQPIDSTVPSKAHTVNAVAIAPNNMQPMYAVVPILSAPLACVPPPPTPRNFRIAGKLNTLVSISRTFLLMRPSQQMILFSPSSTSI